MVAALLLAVYILAGLAIVRFMLPGHRPLVRIWLGASLGLLLFMWLPALMAFFMRFTLAAQFASLAPLSALVFAAWLLRDKRKKANWDETETKLLIPLGSLLLLFGALSTYLQYTHVLREAADGSLHVGQSTYGDLMMHLSFITSFKDAAFPPTYAMLKGELLCYPFLADSLSTSLYLGGMTLRMAVILPGVLMMLLLYMGFFLLADRFSGGGKTAILAFLLFFLNGGLGFIYTLDLSGGEKLFESLREIMTGFYKTPTNQPTPYNLRWSNLICDLLIPQRTFLAGYTMVVPCFYLLFSRDRKPRTRLLLGLWAGLLPMVHTHSFLALALCSLGIMLFDLCHGEKFKPYLIYGTAAACLALPQLFTWTLTQATSSEGFLSLHFNWVNNVNGEMIDNYLWFYIKNIGLPFIFILMALFEKNPRYRRVFAGAFVIFAVAECVQFQRNPYDNNKLFYLWYMLCCLIIADYMRLIWQRLRVFRGRYALAVIMAVCLFLSAGLTIARETVSDYQAFSAEDVKTAAFINANTETADTFLTGTQHLNPVISLCGRTIPVSSSSWLHYHGYDTGERKREVASVYEAPEDNLAVLKKYDVRYIYVSAYERAEYDVAEITLKELFPLVYDSGYAQIYQVEGV